jgi:hypothetical protein
MGGTPGGSGQGRIEDYGCGAGGTRMGRMVYVVD